jgi:GT2 family glycosyltransferase
VEADPAPRASVVIATKDRPAELARVLEALRAQETAFRFEVIVVDDGSDPPLPDAVLAELDAATLLRSSGRGPAAARNEGVRAARGAYVLFTDDDTRPATGWVEAACAFLEAHPDHAAVEGPVRSPAFDPLYEHSLESDAPGAYWTCNMAYRADAFRDLGGFLEDFPDPHCEDLDLAYRAARIGPIGFEPGMEMTHFPRPLPLRGWIARARLTRSEALLMTRHRERYGRAARLPPRLFPLTSALHNWRLQFRHQSPDLLRSPRRLARFLLVSGAYLGTVMLTIARPERR